MVNRFLEEKDILYMFVYGFLFYEENVNFVFWQFSFSAKNHGLAAELQKNVVQQLIDQYINDLILRFKQKKIYISSQCRY